MRRLAIIGCGGFGRETLDIAEAINAIEPTWDVIGFFDDAPQEIDLDLISHRGYGVLGGVPDVKDIGDCMYVIGIGSGAARRAIDMLLTDAGCEPATLVHPSVTSGPQNRIGPGAVLCAGVRLTSNIVLGRHVHVNLNSTIGHDSTLGSYVTVNPLVAVSGCVSTEEASTLGTGSCVLQGLTLGAAATVGGAACVTKHVDAGTTVVGIPAKPLARKSD